MSSRIATLRTRVALTLMGTVGLITGLTVPAYAESTFTSSSAQVHLVELYTSEGCSSCPPADRWMGSLQTNPALWKQVVPVAFHVDYWDYLGWKDEYSRAEFTDRQQRYARLRQVSGVYTPGMFLDGQEWRDWRGSFDSDELKGAEPGQLTLKFDRQQSTVSFAPSTSFKKQPGKAHLALLGVNIDSPIKGGENRGKKLRHDFVVLELVSADLQRTESGFTARLPAITTGLTAPKYAVAAWVTNDNDSKPVQVTGGWLPERQ